MPTWANKWDTVLVWNSGNCQGENFQTIELPKNWRLPKIPKWGGTYCFSILPKLQLGRKYHTPCSNPLVYIEQDHNFATYFNFNPFQAFNTNPGVVKLIFSSKFSTSQLQAHFCRSLLAWWWPQVIPNKTSWRYPKGLKSMDLYLGNYWIDIYVYIYIYNRFYRSQKFTFSRHFNLMGMSKKKLFLESRFSDCHILRRVGD